VSEGPGQLKSSERELLLMQESTSRFQHNSSLLNHQRAIYKAPRLSHQLGSAFTSVQERELTASQLSFQVFGNPIERGRCRFCQRC